MNSFRAVQRALEYEIERQTAVLEAGGTLVQETRGWVEAQGRTISQRSKEQAHDYRYFPEPDLPPLRLDSAFVERVRATLPELPEARAARFQSQYGLTAYDAAVLTDTRESADTYEALVGAGVPAKLAANWQSGDVAALANEHRLPLQQSGLGIAGLARAAPARRRRHHQRPDREGAARGAVRRRRRSRGAWCASVASRR